MTRSYGGSSVGDHLKSARRQKGKPEPKAPALPPEAVHLWDTFLELTRRRHGNGFAPLPITHQDIRAWSELKQWPLAPWEIDAILALDDAFLSAQADT